MPGSSRWGLTHGTMTDITPVVGAWPVDAVGERISGALCGLDAGAETHGTEHPATVGQHLARFEPGAGMKDLAGQPCGALESLDGIAAAHAFGIAGRGHDDPERGTRIPVRLRGIQPAGERRLA